MDQFPGPFPPLPEPFLLRGGGRLLCRSDLFKVLRTALKQGLVLVPGDVEPHKGTPALHVTHFAEDPAVWGENTLDCLH